MSSPSSTQKRRKYSTRACVFCRNRHKKCDGGQPCVACDKRKQECVYPEQQKKRGPKPRIAQNLGTNSTNSLNSHQLHVNSVMGSSAAVLTSVEFSSMNNNHKPSAGLVAVHGGVNHHGGIAVVNSEQQGKTKRRRLSLNSEEILPAVAKSGEIVMTAGPEQINLCHWLQEIIQLIQQHPHVSPFLHPVSLSDAPDYYDIIDQPMDFSRMNEKINTFQYVSVSQFYMDLNLLVDNCRKYNQGTRSAYLIDWAIELQQTILQEIQKRMDTVMWYPKPVVVDPLDHFESYRSNNDMLEIDLSLYPQMLSAPLENWSIFDSCDFLESSFSSPYSVQEFQV